MMGFFFIFLVIPVALLNSYGIVFLKSTSEMDAPPDGPSSLGGDE